MTQDEFLTRWNSEKAIYKAWGTLVGKRIEDALRSRLGDRMYGFFKVPPDPRVKEDNSLLAKAFLRKKGYKNPYEDITDKVGIRFIVLSLADVALVCQTIESLFEHSKDKDPEQEVQNNPYRFDYQSVHYVVRSQITDAIDGTQITPGIPCEIQVRTLLQHAVAELTHSITYKPKSAPPSSQTYRYCARSSALAEAVDEYIDKVNKEVRSVDTEIDTLATVLDSLYLKKVGLSPANTKLNDLVIDSYIQEPSPVDNIDGWLASKLFIAERIKERYYSNALFRQSSILIVYRMVDQSPSEALEKWPLVEDELRPLFVDLGKQMDSY